MTPESPVNEDEFLPWVRRELENRKFPVDNTPDHTDNHSMNAQHTHTSECLAVNELNETCCRDLADDHLTNACRRTVTFPDAAVHTFTDSDADAIELAVLALDHITDASTARVTFRDLDHRLDTLAPPPGYIRDIDNSELD